MLLERTLRLVKHVASRLNVMQDGLQWVATMLLQPTAMKSWSLNLPIYRDD
jgi:hypothetical protein